MTTTASPAREIRYDAITRDFALLLDGEIVGWARSYVEGEQTLNRICYELAERAGAQAEAPAAPAALDTPEAVVEAINAYDAKLGAARWSAETPADWSERERLVERLEALGHYLVEEGGRLAARPIARPTAADEQRGRDELRRLARGFRAA